MLYFEATELSSPFLQLRGINLVLGGRGNAMDPALSVAFAVVFLLVRTTTTPAVVRRANLR